VGVLKVSDLTDNGVGLIYTTGPRAARLARKYAPLVPSSQASSPGRTRRHVTERRVLVGEDVTSHASTLCSLDGACGRA
jgi:hypothetical protein